MIQKTITQGVIIAALFVAIWFGLSQINFTKIFETEKVADETSEKLGDLLWESIEKSEDVVYRDSVVMPVEKLVYHLAKKNGIDKDDLKVHIIQKDEVNAFAMPDGHLVVYTGLIADCSNESELAGVLGHEIAHIERNHVMKKLAKEIGFSVLVSMTTGGNGGAVQEAIGTLSSSAYDRSLESEADRYAVEYLIEADLDPKKFADFMYKMAVGSDVPEAVYWISTHPESEERAREIVRMIKNKKYKVKPVLTAKEWQGLQKQAGSSVVD